MWEEWARYVLHYLEWYASALNGLHDNLNGLHNNLQGRLEDVTLEYRQHREASAKEISALKEALATSKADSTRSDHALALQVAKLQVKSGITGLIGGLIPAVGVALYFLLKK